MTSAMQKTPSFSMHSPFTPNYRFVYTSYIDWFDYRLATGATPDRRGQHGRLLSHVYSLPMGVDGPYGRPLQPRMPRDMKAAPSRPTAGPATRSDIRL